MQNEFYTYKFTRDEVNTLYVLLEIALKKEGYKVLSAINHLHKKLGAAHQKKEPKKEDAISKK